MRVVQGFEVGRSVPEAVLKASGLDSTKTVDQLVAAAALHDTANPGYLSRAELQKGANDLTGAAPTTTPTPTALRFAAGVLADVKDQYQRSSGRTWSDAEVIGAAAQWDDGNGYLKRQELEAGAMELQFAVSGQPLSTADIASIRTWTGCERKGTTTTTAPELGVVSDIDKTLMPPEVRGQPTPNAYPGVAALLQLLEKGPQGTGALGDVTYVTARNPARVVGVPAWMARNNLPVGNIETGVSTVPWVAENEKVKDIEKLFRADPTKQFVLFGDTNHRDPDVYKRIRDMFPTQVKAVIMHDVKTVDPARLTGHHVVKNYAEASAILMKLKVIDEPSARSVMLTAQSEGLAITAVDITTLIQTHQP